MMVDWVNLHLRIFFIFEGFADDVTATDGLPVSTLSYTGGIGAQEELEHIDETGHRRNLTYEQLSKTMTIVISYK